MVRPTLAGMSRIERASVRASSHDRTSSVMRRSVNARRAAPSLAAAATRLGPVRSVTDRAEAGGSKSRGRYDAPERSDGRQCGRRQHRRVFRYTGVAHPPTAVPLGQYGAHFGKPRSGDLSECRHDVSRVMPNASGLERLGCSVDPRRPRGARGGDAND
eukprot:jgi/Tetstr1/458525/TSEL_044930.t1